MADVNLPPLPEEINQLISRHNQVSMDLAEAVTPYSTKQAVEELVRVRESLSLAIRRRLAHAATPLPAAQTITLAAPRATPADEEVLAAAAPRELLALRLPTEGEGS